MRPAAVETEGVYGVRPDGVHHVAAVDVVGGRLGRGHEAGAQPHRLGAEHQRRGQPPTVGDPAGRDHRHRVDRVHDGRHERQGGRPAAYMPTRLPTLRHDHIDAGVDRPPRLLRAADRVQVQRPAVVDRVVDRRGVAPEGRDDPDAFGEAGVQPVRDREVEDEVDAEPAGGQLPHPADAGGGSTGSDPGQRQHPEPAGARHGGDQFRRGGRADRRLDDRERDSQPVTQGCP